MERIKGLDGLRALALAAVFLQHYSVIGQKLELGGYGVWLFFVLSGFLIVRILHEERKRVEAGETTVPRALGRFFWRRTLRIFPIYYLCLAVCVVLALVGLTRDRLWPDMGWHAAYLSNVYFGEVAGAWIGRFGHFWSLAIEEQFYLLAAPALLFSPARWSRPLCAILVGASLATNLFMRTSGANEMQLYTSSLINFGALAFGGWLALGLGKKPPTGDRSWPALIPLVLYVAVIFAFAHLGRYHVKVALLIAIIPLVGSTLFGGLAIRSVYLNPQSRLVQVLELWPLRAFGRISYGFYLYHNLIPRRIGAKLMALAGHPAHFGPWTEAAVSFSVALLLAVLSWRLIEQPLLRLKDRPPRWAGLAEPRPAAAA